MGRASGDRTLERVRMGFLLAAFGLSLGRGDWVGAALFGVASVLQVWDLLDTGEDE